MINDTVGGELVVIIWQAGTASPLLREIARSSRNARQARRAQALLWLHENYSAQAVADRLGMSRQTVQRWKRQYQQRAEDPVQERIQEGQHTGRVPHQLSRARQEIERVWQRDPRRYGFRALNRTVPMLRCLIHRHTADLRDEQTLRVTVEQTRSTLGLIDILVNSGGVINVSPIHEIDMQAWDSNMDINLRAPTVLCAAVLPGMRERKRGYIVNIASEAGVFIYGGMGAYAVSKHALRVLTELIQEENQDLGIKAWAICPDFVDTPLAAWASGANRDNMLTVEEVVGIVRFVLTQGSNVKLGPEILIRTTRSP